MMELATAVGTSAIDAAVGKIMQYTFDPAARQVGYLMHYRRNVEYLRDQVDRLKGERIVVQHSVDTAKRNGEEIEEMVQSWLNRANEIISEIDEFLNDDRNAKMSRHKWSCPNFWSRYRVSRKATKRVQEIVDIHGEGTFDKVSYRPAPQGIGTALIKGYEEFDSRMKILKVIMEAITDAKTNSIGVYGMGGVGKTMLVKEVARQARESKAFDQIVMATVTQTANVKKIQEEIADMLGLKFEEKSEVGRAGRLQARLRMEKDKVLVIFDDIWEMIDLDAVGIPYSDDQKGCKILMTSRKRDVLEEMGTQKILMLDVLRKEEARQFFNKMAHVSNEDPELNTVAKEVADKCGELPFEIAASAKALRGRSLPIWKDALNQLTSGYSIMDLSYKFLRKEEAKSLLLLCSLFPEDYQINIKYLLMYAMGMGLLNEVNTLREARDRIISLVHDLKDSCLLLDGINEDFVKMHDVVRDFSISVASKHKSKYLVKYGGGHNAWPKVVTSKDYAAISLGCTNYHELPEDPMCSILKFLLLVGRRSNLKIPENFFKGMKQLRVLDLTGLCISSLPSSIRLLENLQTLCLDECELPDIAIIGELKKLEILSFRASNIEALPGVIVQLTCLKMLNLLDCSKLKVIPPNLLSCLTELAELYMDNSFVEWDVNDEGRNAGISELDNLSQLSTLHVHIPDAKILPKSSVFQGLSSYKIFIGDGWDWSDQHDASRTLKLKLNRSLQKEDAIHALLENAEDLHLDKLINVKSILRGLNPDGFPRLKHLNVQNNDEIQSIISSLDSNRPPSFPVLETMFLKSLANLERICIGRLQHGAFASLKKVKLENCGKMEFVLQSFTASGLSKLEEMEISKCGTMKAVVAKEVEREMPEFPELRSLMLHHLPGLVGFHCYQDSKPSNHGFHPLFDQEVSFPKLESLKLSSLNLGRLWQEQLPTSFFYAENLTFLLVEDCNNLEYLFSIDVARRFVNLKRLEIRNCCMMKDVLDVGNISRNQVATHSNFPQQMVMFPNLKTVLVSGMDSLESLWGCEFALGSFAKLKTVQISSCKKITSIFPDFMTDKVINLEMLSITQCESLEYIFEIKVVDQVSNAETCLANQLRQVNLHRLPKLKNVWSEDPKRNLAYPNLRVVHAIQCQSLKNLFPASIAKGLAQLEDIKVQFCGVVEIVAEGEGDATFELSNVSTMSLWNLFELVDFYPGQHTLECPSLTMFDVRQCPRFRKLISLENKVRRQKEKVESHKHTEKKEASGRNFQSNDYSSGFTRRDFQTQVKETKPEALSANTSNEDEGEIGELKRQLAIVAASQSQILEEISKLSSIAGASFDAMNEIQEKIANIRRTADPSIGK